MTMAKIMIVEDNEMNRDMLSRRLERCGYRICLATNGTEALDVAVQEHPDLVLMDIGLGEGIDGLETTRRLRRLSNLQTIPIIALTARALVTDREQCLAAGCSDYDTKPVDLQRLLSKINTLLTH